MKKVNLVLTLTSFGIGCLVFNIALTLAMGIPLNHLHYINIGMGIGTILSGLSIALIL